MTTSETKDPSELIILPKKVCLLCGVKSKKEGLPHFRFPKDLALRSAWADFCKVDVTALTTCHKLCSRHFSADDYCNRLRARLKKDSVPTIEIICEEDENVSKKKSRKTEFLLKSVIKNTLARQKSDGSEPLVSNVRDELNNDIRNYEVVNGKISEDMPVDLNNLEALKAHMYFLKEFIEQEKRNMKRIRKRNVRLKQKLENIKKEYFLRAQNTQITVLPETIAMDHSYDNVPQSLS